MDKKLKIYIVIFVVTVAAIIYADGVKQKPINWFPSFASNHKIPFGTFVLKEELSSLFPKTKIKTVKRIPYLFLKDTTQKGTYFFVDGAVNFGKEEFNEILKFIERGNDVFLSTNGANIDTLGIKTKKFYTTTFEEKAFVSLINPQFKNTEYHFGKQFGKFYFSEIDTLKTTTLGSILIKDTDNKVVGKEINFIKQKYGKGNLFLHTFPLAFTNYNILHENNQQYVADVLSYIDGNKTIIWDAYYKTGKSKITTPMHYVLSSKSLKWAYYIALIGVMFFVLFKGKRNQRFIPIITPLKNQTLAFTRTIANVYFEKSEHKNIATHKINYFFEHIRTQYRISTLEINNTFFEDLSKRSGVKLEEVKQVFSLIKEVQASSKINKQKLVDLNKQIEAFKH